MPEQELLSTKGLIQFILNKYNTFSPKLYFGIYSVHVGIKGDIEVVFYVVDKILGSISKYNAKHLCSVIITGAPLQEASHSPSAFAKVIEQEMAAFIKDLSSKLDKDLILQGRNPFTQQGGFNMLDIFTDLRLITFESMEINHSNVTTWNVTTLPDSTFQKGDN